MENLTSRQPLFANLDRAFTSSTNTSQELALSRKTAAAADANRNQLIIFLFRCPLWSNQRQNICKVDSKFNRWGDLSFALGGWSGEGKDGDRTKWKPSLEMVAATIKFALETERLGDVQSGEEAGKRDTTTHMSGEDSVNSINSEDDLSE